MKALQTVEESKITNGLFVMEAISLIGSFSLQHI